MGMGSVTLSEDRERTEDENKGIGDIKKLSDSLVGEGWR